MMKQAALEIWYGFCRNIKTWKGIGIILFMVFISWGYIMNSIDMYIFFFSFLLGSYMPMLTGSRTGKLCMILPVTPKEQRKLLFAKGFWLGAFLLLLYTILFVFCKISLQEYIEKFFIMMLPSVLIASLVYITSMLPVKGVTKEYKRGVWSIVAGILCSIIAYICYDTDNVIFSMYVKMILTVLAYVFILWGYKLRADWMEHQMIYYDVVEKDAEKVQW